MALNGEFKKLMPQHVAVLFSPQNVPEKSHALKRVLLSV